MVALIGCSGSIAPMIELGAGFDMVLTARKNIFLNGAVLGYDRTYMNEHFESIINFAELRGFIDVPYMKRLCGQGESDFYGPRPGNGEAGQTCLMDSGSFFGTERAG